MRFSILFCLSAVLLLLGAASTALADVPQLINCQGILLDDLGDPVTTSATVIFAIWDAETDGDSLWSEEQSVTPDDEGRFSILLGTVSPIPDSAFAGIETYLSIKVDTDPEMVPRQRIASVAYAFRDNDWSLVDDVLFTQGEWGLARAGNTLFGDNDSTHVNLGVACTTGTSGEHYPYATVGGGLINAAGGQGATVGGGLINTADGNYATVAGGYRTEASGGFSTVGGGGYNTASGYCATVGGGVDNTASGFDYATVGGGIHNTAEGTECATVGGGANNTASGNYATVGGGSYNTASGDYATIPGGRLNTASGNYSFAAGRRAKANHTGTFAWGDGTDADFTSTAVNQFRARASGGVWFYTGADLSTGVTVPAGGGAWSSVSNRELKRNIRPVYGAELLEKLAQLEVSRWSYKSQDESIEHIGPMAQDFYRLFGVGDDNKTISTIDPDGIALAAIQELYQQNQELKKENDEIRAELAEMQALMQQLLAKRE